MRLQSKKPRFDLQKAQRAVNIQIPRSVWQKANESLLKEKPSDALEVIKSVFHSLVPADFAHTEMMPRVGAKPLFGDVYSKRHESIDWFVKFWFDGTTYILSCHEQEHPLQLAGRPPAEDPDPTDPDLLP